VPEERLAQPPGRRTENESGSSDQASAPRRSQARCRAARIASARPGLRGRLGGEGDLLQAERRAASSTEITDWCGAAASALTITTLSLPALAASARAAASSSTPRPFTGWRLTM
jgi:hypothetical protein